MGAETNSKEHPFSVGDESISKSDDRRQTVGEINIQYRNDSLFEDSETECSEGLDDEDHMMPGLLEEAIAYTITSVLAQGWVHKKGTGMDLFASRAWKARWTVLALAKVAGHQADIPILQIFWNAAAPSPSTVIILNSAIVLPKDDPDQTKWNCHRFEIRHVKKPVDDSFTQMTRIFSCPREGRDKWVYAMNQALLEYEKEKATCKILHNSIPPRFAFAICDDFPKVQKQKHKRPALPISPPLVAKSPRAPLPEPPLAGVVFLE